VAISSTASDGFVPSWIGKYARNNSIHLLVIAFFAIYPGLQYYIASAEGVTILKLLLPDMTSMQLLMTAGLFAVSFDFISGYTGYLSFGHSLFYGTGMFFVIGVRVGAFSDFPVLSAIPQDLHFMYLMILAGLVALILALIVGSFSFRLTGVYFAMITLGVAELARFTVRGYVPAESQLSATGDLAVYNVGIPFVDEWSITLGRFASNQIALGEIPILAQFLDILNAIPFLGAYIVPDATIQWGVTSFYLLGIVALISYYVMQRILHSPFGRVMIAIRENEERAEAIGYNTFWYKMGAFAISAFFGAIAGALEAGRSNSAVTDPAFAVLDRAGEALLATIIGGMGTLAGPFYGYLFDRNLRELFGNVSSAGIVQYLEDNAQFILDFELLGVTVDETLNIWVQGQADLYVGLVFVLFILYVPGGLLGSVRNAMGGKLAHAFPEWVGRRVSSLRSLINR
jgi:branched-chain amino acid transport system permease protein